MVVPLMLPDEMLGVLVATMVMEEEPPCPPGPLPPPLPPLEDTVGIWNENTDVLPFLKVYHVLLLYDDVLLVTPERLLPLSNPPTATTLPPLI